MLATTSVARTEIDASPLEHLEPLEPLEPLEKLGPLVPQKNYNLWLTKRK